MIPTLRRFTLLLDAAADFRFITRALLRAPRACRLRYATHVIFPVRDFVDAVTHTMLTRRACAAAMLLKDAFTIEAICTRSGAARAVAARCYAPFATATLPP